MGTKLKIKFGDVRFEYKGEAAFTKDDILDLISALYQGSVWETDWEEFGLGEDDPEGLELDDEDEGDDDSDDEDDDPQLLDDVVDALLIEVEIEEDVDGEDGAEDDGDEGGGAEGLPLDEADEPEVDYVDEAPELFDAEVEEPEGVDEVVDADVEEPLPLLSCDPQELNSACGVLVAERLGADSPAASTLAAAATLELLEGVSPFTRDQLKDALAASGEYSSDSYLHNLSRAMGDLLEDGMLVEQRAGQYRLSADARRDIEAKLA